MNAIRFGIYAGIIWTALSLILIEMSVLDGASSAWVELDFRFLTGLTLTILHWLDLGDSVYEIIQYAQFGLPISAVNVTIAAFLGFIDGFASGFFIAIYFNAISIIFERYDLPATLKFGVATGKVFGICSGLLGLVTMYYNFSIKSFDFSIRPIFLFFSAIPETSLTSIKDSYMLFPHTYWGVVEWTLWGFVDGFIGGAAICFLLLYIRKKLRPIEV